MAKYIELKTKDGKPRTCTIKGKHKKLYMDAENPDVKYIRDNKQYIPKDEYAAKKKQRGGAGDDNQFIIVVILSVEDKSKFSEKYYIAETDAFDFKQKIDNGFNLISDGSSGDKQMKNLQEILKSLPPPIKYEMDKTIYVFAKSILEKDLNEIKKDDDKIVQTKMYPKVSGTNQYKKFAKGFEFKTVDDLKTSGLNVFKDHLEKPFMKMMYLFGGKDAMFQNGQEYNYKVNGTDEKNKTVIEFLDSDAKTLEHS
jgi:hypothetical protein